MPVQPLIDLNRFNLDQILFGREVIRSQNPHRGAMELLDGIIHYDPEGLEAVGFHDLAEQAFWTAGHIPGFPLFPGAMMIESAAQLSSFCYRKRFGFDQNRFFGFGGIDRVKFRGMAQPNDRLYLLCTDIVLNRRYSRFNVQGICKGKIIFDGEIQGVAMPVPGKAEVPNESSPSVSA